MKKNGQKVPGPLTHTITLCVFREKWAAPQETVRCPSNSDSIVSGARNGGWAGRWHRILLSKDGKAEDLMVSIVFFFNP